MIHDFRQILTIHHHSIFYLPMMYLAIDNSLINQVLTEDYSIQHCDKILLRLFIYIYIQIQQKKYVTFIILMQFCLLEDTK